MESNFSDSMCRCCASEGVFKDFNSTYQWMGAEEVYADMLKDCFDITLTVSETINSGGICEVCITQLRNAFNFKKQVQYTEEQFKRKIEEMKFKTEIVKVEEAGEDDFPSDHNLSDDDFSSPEYDIPIIKMESSSESAKSKKRATKGATTRSKKAKTEDGETSAKRDENSIVVEVDGGLLLKDDDEEEQVNSQGSNKTEVEKHQFNIKEILLNTNATPIRCHGGLGYTCCFCSQQFPEAKDLKQHVIGGHNDIVKSNFMKGRDMHGYFVKLDITDLQCKCGEVIMTLEDLLCHLKHAHNIDIFFDVKNHILPFKFDFSVMRCFMCMNIFNTFKALQEHMNVHYRNYICEFCNAGFVSKNNLLRHGAAHKLGSFTCQICNKEFDTARKKTLHHRSKHAVIKFPHKCGHCDERFKEVWQKYSHLSKVHGVQAPEIKCLACDKVFDTKNAWRLHTTRVHLMQRPHKCDHCEKDFYTKRELASHMVKHTGARDFFCPGCAKSFGRQKNLKEHIRRMHSSE
ncbi:zinc finger and BTB domain-containing protein 24-like isoform X14 [Leptidea sinapis]|uniref:zinc finger and BTB domain-containing protein 24-like isoform X14 n=1 Tax=Leptidea sinapis TaxID=189913 RepID=UPI0021C4C8B8|nr:zinc finger and BTB domain-containing protein 24-like isoform X14 [Leptidea sinapis]